MAASWDCAYIWQCIFSSALIRPIDLSSSSGYYIFSCEVEYVCEKFAFKKLCLSTSHQVWHHEVSFLASWSCYCRCFHCFDFLFRCKSSLDARPDLSICLATLIPYCLLKSPPLPLLSIPAATGHAETMELPFAGKSKLLSRWRVTWAERALASLNFCMLKARHLLCRTFISKGNMIVKELKSLFLPKWENHLRTLASLFRAPLGLMGPPSSMAAS